MIDHEIEIAERRQHFRLILFIGHFVNFDRFCRESPLLYTLISHTCIENLFNSLSAVRSIQILFFIHSLYILYTLTSEMVGNCERFVHRANF